MARTSKKEAVEDLEELSKNIKLEADIVLILLT